MPNFLSNGMSGLVTRTRLNQRGGHIWNVKEKGLVGDGVTDDTAAMQALVDEIYSTAVGTATVLVPAGTYIFGGALQDTGASNAQITIPHRSLDDEQLCIEFVGVSRPQVQFYPGITNDVPATGYSVFKSTLTGATGTAAMIGGKGAAEHGQNQINTQVCIRNIITQLPTNSTLTGWNLQECQACEIKDLLIHCGEVNLASITEPTNSNAYGIKLPAVNHSPYTRVEGLTVFGMNTGVLFGELITASGLRTWGCRNGLEIPFSYHPSIITDLGTYWGPIGIYVSGSNNIFIGVWDMEHANGQGAAWQDQVADLSDGGNQLYGEARYVAVSSGLGNDHTFTKIGGTHFLAVELGGAIGSELITLDSALTIDDTTIEVTFSREVKSLDYEAGVVISVNATPVSISASTRQTDKTKVRYTVPTLVGTDTITLDYTKVDGFLESESGTQIADTSISVSNALGVLTTLDNFTDSDGTTLASHTIAPTNVASTSWTALENTFHITSNKALPAASGVCSAYQDSGVTDIYMSCTVRRSGTSDTALMFRVVDTDNYWIAVFSASGQLIIYEKTGGTYTSRANVGVTYTTNTDFLLEVQVTGNLIEAHVGGFDLSWTSSVHATATKQGIWTSGTADAGSFDTFSVTST